jgi:ligand-binding sensor domain-containing protein/DNA-binding CsgD family transcriptional regulator
MKKYLLFLVFVINSSLGFSQELPPITNYIPKEYGAGNQNWMISQDKNQFIYFANNEGLLEFNGSTWTLYPSPNETILRSVKVINNIIYTGCYMEFGFWKRQANGQLSYTSLSKKIKNKIVDDEQFWNILHYDKWVIFQSLNKIYIYDTVSQKFSIISPKSTIIKAFKTSNNIYFQCANEGLFEIENGKSKLISNDPVFKNNRIVNLFATKDGLLVQTQLNGLFKINAQNILLKFNTEVDELLKESSIYSSEMLTDGSMALGSISNGVFIISNEGKLKYHLTQNKGLSNNTTLSLLEDADQNLWIGLDNGINCINLKSPVKTFTDHTGILGTVYASILHNNRLYIGTNQGLFSKLYTSNGAFEYIRGTKGQVWSLYVKYGTLFCGHDSGTFIINETNSNLIFNQSGTWKFETDAKYPGLIIQGNYYGMSVLEYKNNQWQFRNKIAGFNYSSRYFEMSSNKVIVSHEYKGVFEYTIDKNALKATEVRTFKNPEKGKNASLTKFNNSIYYAYKKGIFKYNTQKKTFEKEKQLSKIFENEEYTSGKLIVDKSNKIWVFTKNYLHYYTLSKLSSELKKNSIPIPSSLTNSMSGFENITEISNSIYLIGTTDGYYTINLDELSFKNYSVSISKISSNKTNENLTNSIIKEDGEFSYDENNITIHYTVPEYNKYINTEYQYLLEGLQDNWSSWSVKSNSNFKNLSPGTYTFKVRAKVANSSPENIATYTFTISKPWYATNLAIIIYLLFSIIIAYYINEAYKKYYQKIEAKLIEENNLLLEIKELETEQQLMKIRNEQLTQDVDEKNKELAVSTMSLIKKNELLAVIKEDLKKTSEEGSHKNIKSVITTITRNINEEDTWNVFKEAFDNADKDFLKKIKAAHASLTPNDLRLCAYLRLNLSSKEIAPLLNISVRSVEIKRYRLRKKMDLPHEQGLVEYILSI